MNNDELGNRIRLSGLPSSPWAPSCTITSQGHVPRLYCRLSAAHFSSAPSKGWSSPPAYTPLLLFGTISRFALVSLLIQLKNDPTGLCCSITSLLLSQLRLRALKSEPRDPAHLQAHSSISSACGCQVHPAEGLAKVVQHPVLFPSPQSLSPHKRRNQVPRGQAQVVLQSPSQSFSLHLVLD